MDITELREAKVTGFYSMPPGSLAGENPDAYRNAMLAAPAGAGTCAYCGTGIRHHVIIQTKDNVTHFIGTDCAEKIGGEIGECARTRMTSGVKALRDARVERENAEWRAVQADLAAARAARAAKFKDVLDFLLLLNSQQQFIDSIWISLHNQLSERPLTERQAQCILKQWFSQTGRRNKTNAKAWDELLERLTT